MPHTRRLPPLLALPILASMAFLPDAHADPPDTAAASLPLLESNSVHLYVQEAYEAFPHRVTRAVAARHSELVDAGMDSARHLVDWSDLQPDATRVNTQLVRDAMRQRTDAGIEHQFVNITVIDSSGAEAIPVFVRDLLEAGVAWDDPRIVGPFTRVLDEIVPVIIDGGGYMIGFANEPASYYEEEPEAAASFTRFVEAAIAHTRTINEDLATTIVFAGTTDTGIPDLMPLIDVASFNYYAYGLATDTGCDIDGYTLPLYHSAGGGMVGPALDEMLRVADGRLVCIQEFGQATGWEGTPTTLGARAGLDTQREVMLALVRELAERRERFRTVCVWTLNDHTREGMRWIADAVVAEGLPACYAANIAEIFGPTGLVRSDPEASKKPAFEAVRDAILPLKSGDVTAIDAVLERAHD